MVIDPRAGASPTQAGVEGSDEAESIEFGPLLVVPAEFHATLDGRRLQLTHKEFRLLAFFATRPGRVCHRDRIAEAIWEGDAPGRTIDIHVSRLRRMLPSGWIETVVRVGYRFAPP